MTGAATRLLQSGGSDEPGILKKACRIANSDDSATFPAAIYRNEFILAGPTAEHFCIVTEPLSLSLQAFNTTFFGQCGGMPIWMIKRLVRSVLLALAHLHENCDVVYAGQSLVFSYGPQDYTH
jgi:hypothetical protein